MDTHLTQLGGEMTLADLARSVVAQQEPGGPRLAALVIPPSDPYLPGLILTVEVPPDGIREWVAEA